MRKSVYTFINQITFAIVVAIIYLYVKKDIRFIDLVSMLFINGTYLMFLCTPYFTKNTLNKTISDLPAYTCSLIFLFIQIRIAIFVGSLEDVPKDIYTLIQTILTGIYLIVLFVIFKVNESTATSIEKQDQDVVYIKEIKTILRKLSTQIFDNKSLKGAVDELIDIIQTSPANSVNELYPLENRIIDSVKSLETKILEQDNTNDLLLECSHIKILLEERNSQLKLSQIKQR